MADKAIEFSAGSLDHAVDVKRPAIHLPLWFDYSVPLVRGGIGEICDYAELLHGSTVRQVGPTQQPFAFKVGFLPSFLHDFYYSIHYDPARADVGNVISEMFVPIKIFNAYFERRTMTKIEFSGFDGLETNIVTPLRFEALETKTIQVKILTDGPSVIDAKLSMFWDTPKDNYIFEIVGSRSIMLGFPAVAPYTERYEWLTTIYDTQNASEERQAVRAQPRWTITADRPCYGPNERQIAQNLAFGWIKRAYSVPLWTETTLGTAEIEAGQLDVPCDTSDRDLRLGGTVLLWSSPTDYEPIELAEIRSTGIRSARPIKASRQAGSYMIVPVLSALANTGLTVTGTHSDAMLSGTLEMRDPVKDYSGRVWPTYNGIPIAPLPMRAPTATDNYKVSFDSVDNKSNMPYRKSFDERAKRTRAGYYLAEGLAQVVELKQWLWYCRGRLSTFWQYSNMRDLTCLEAGHVSSSMRVTACQYTGMATARNHIRFTMRDGSVHHARITTSAANPDGTESILFDPALERESSEISHISFLSLCRMDSDTMDLQWSRGDCVNCDISVKEI